VSTWPGIYKLAGIESRNYVHYATKPIAEPIAVTHKLTLKVKPKSSDIITPVSVDSSSVTVIVRKEQSDEEMLENLPFRKSCDHLLSITREEKARIVGETYVKGIKVMDVQAKHGICELTRWRNEVKRGTLIPIYDNPVDPLPNRLTPPFIWDVYIPKSGKEGLRIRALASG
jgi:hypothetical protein